MLAGIDHCIFEIAQEGGAIEQAGGLVALAQLFQLLHQLGVGFGGLMAENNLLAMFALIFGGHKLHDRWKFFAIAIVRGQLVTRRRVFALGQTLEQGFERFYIWRGDQIQ